MLRLYDKDDILFLSPESLGLRCQRASKLFVKSDSAADRFCVNKINAKRAYYVLLKKQHISGWSCGMPRIVQKSAILLSRTIGVLPSPLVPTR